jgi:hypothetical protein
MSDLNANGKSYMDECLDRIGSPEKREAFLRSQMRVQKFKEDEEILSLVNYLDNFAVLINALTKDVVPHSNGSQPLALPVKPESDHVVRFNEMSEAFARLTEVIQEQKLALVKISKDQDKTYSKVNLFVERQPEKKLTNTVKWSVASVALLLLVGSFFLGMWWDQGIANDRIKADHAASLSYVRDIVNALHSPSTTGR